jgi:hypothetical protein
LSHPPEKYDFVRLDHHPNLVGENNPNVPNHQPDFQLHFYYYIPINQDLDGEVKSVKKYWLLF